MFNMKRNPVRKEQVTAVLAVALFYGALQLAGITCPIKYITGISCPGCGMTRAWLSVLRLDIAAAFGYHYLFWTVPILYLFFWFDGVLFKKKQLDRVIFFGILAAFCIRWVAVLASHTHLFV